MNDDMSHYQMYVSGKGKVSIPLPASVKKADVRFNGKKISSSLVNHQLILDIAPAYSGKRLDIKMK